MQLTPSPYLEHVHDALRAIIDRLSDEFAFVSILGTDVKGKVMSLDSSGMSLAPSNDEERGFVCRVYGEHGFSEYAFNELSDLDAIADAVRRLASDDRARFLEHHEALPYDGPPVEEAMERVYRAEVSVLPESLDTQAIFDTFRTLHDRARERDARIVSLYLGFNWTQVDKIYLSTKKDLRQTYLYSEFIAEAVARDGDDVKSDYITLSSTDVLNDPNVWEATVDETCRNTLELMTAERIEPGEYDIICDPDFAGLIAHEAFGHGAEMDMFVKDRAKGREYLGQAVASPHVSMHDGATACLENSSYLFDDEGNLGSDTLVIDQGIFRAGMADQLAAMQLGIPPTGNGKRQFYNHKAYTRMTNTFFAPGEDSLDDMIASIKFGYLLEGARSGMEDPKNWGIQCEATRGREIVDGKLTGKIVSPVYMTGYVPDLLKTMTMVSPDLKLWGGGYCGKGWKEWVKVSCGGPYIKARAKLS